MVKLITIGNSIFFFLTVEISLVFIPSFRPRYVLVNKYSNFIAFLIQLSPKLAWQVSWYTWNHCSKFSYSTKYPGYHRTSRMFSHIVSVPKLSCKKGAMTQLQYGLNFILYLSLNGLQNINESNELTNVRFNRSSLVHRSGI